ncbi:MAG: TonB-dependent receptor [Granulosicoccus sp.]|nr:TonB-dependent receptor [Granulosicoccus sp.]
MTETINVSDDRQRVNKFILLLLLAIAMCLGSPAAVIANEFGFVEDDLPIVLSASRLRQTINKSSASVTVLDREIIEASGARSVVDLLSLVPGFQVGRLSNGIPVATYRGQSERFNPRMQLLIDGRPTYVPLYGGIPWGELPLSISEIERVEVIRAPNSATFGPNSFYAVISITTRSPQSDAGWIVEAEAGGNDYISPTLSYFGKWSDIDFRINLKTEQDQGFDGIDDRERAKQAGFRAHKALNNTDTLELATGGIVGGHIERVTVLEPGDLTNYLVATNHYTQMIWERSKSTDESVRLQYYYNYLKLDDRDIREFDLGVVTQNPATLGIPFTVDIDRRAKSTRHEVEFQHNLRVNEDHRVVYGAALRRDTVQGRYIFADFDERSILSQRVFLHSEFQFNDKNTVNSGVLVDHNDLSGVSFSPRVSLIHSLRDNQQLRLGYSRSVRSPLSLEEEGRIEFIYQLPDGNNLTLIDLYDEQTLKPEYIDVVDLGYFFVSSDGSLTFDAKLSHQKLSDQIRTARNENFDEDVIDGEARFFTNRASSTLNSLEFELEYKPTDRSRFRLSYSYAFDENTEFANQMLTPDHTLSLFGQMKLNRGLNLSAEYYYISDWIWDDVSDQSNVNRLDLRVEKTLKLGTVEASLALQGEWRLGTNVDYLERNQIEDLYFAKLTLRF